MPISYPTSLRIAGPWLVDQQALEGLDDIFVDQRSALLDHAQAELRSFARSKAEDRARDDTAKDIERESERYMERYREDFEASHSKVVLFLKGGKTVRAATFAECFRHPVDSDETVSSFSYSFGLGKVKAEISLPTRYGLEPDLIIDVSPQDDSGAQDLYGALRNWTSEHGPPRWQQRWLKHHDWFNIAAVMWLLIFFFTWVSLSSDLSKTIFRREAHALLEKGLKTADELEAIKLILALSSDYDPIHQVFYHPGSRFYLWLLLGFAVFKSLSVCPEYVIGVWGGRRSLQHWKRWITTLWITIPVYLLTAILLPKLLHILAG